MPNSTLALSRILTNLRARLEEVFSPDTAYGGVGGPTPSTGHCAVVALLIQRFLGGELLSTTIHGPSHWFNRVWFEGYSFDVDLTGDQFGYESVQLAPEGTLYHPYRFRLISEANEETRQRSLLLEERLNYTPCVECYAENSGGYVLCSKCYTDRQGSS